MAEETWTKEQFWAELEELERIPITFEHSPHGARSFCIPVG
jgi:hypothetical protein